MKKYNFKNKVAIVTGASTGIGYALTEELLKKGTKVVACARHIDNLKDLNNKYKKSLLITTCDVRKYQESDKLVEFTIKNFKKIDIVVNNAGVGMLKSVSDTKMNEVDNIFKTNFHGLVYLTKITLPYFEKQKSGLYVNVASIAGKTPSILNSIYSASKHAVIGFSNSIRRELRNKNINVLVVNPTFVDTAFFKKNPQYLKEFGHHTKLVGFIPSEKMAKKTIWAIENNKWELNYPFLADLYGKLCQIAPKFAELFA